MVNKDKFEDLQVFREAHKLTLLVYGYTEKFPRSEDFGLKSQMRRSAVSVAANIVEGNSRNHKKEFLQFLYVAQSSLEETKYHLLLVKDLRCISNTEYDLIHSQAELVGKMLNGLISYKKRSLRT